MKAAKSLLCVLLALTLLLSMASPALALEEVTPESGNILIRNSKDVDASKKTFVAYKILSLQVWKGDNGEVAEILSVPGSLIDFYESFFLLDKTDPNFAEMSFQRIMGMYETRYDSGCVVTPMNFTSFIEGMKQWISPYGGKSVAEGYQFSYMPLGYYVILDTESSASACEPMLVKVAPDCVVEPTVPITNLPDGTIVIELINGDLSHWTFSAYKLIDVIPSVSEEGEIYQYDYSVCEEWVDFFAAYYQLDKNAPDFDTQAATRINEGNEADRHELCMAVYGSATKEPYIASEDGGRQYFNNMPLGIYAIFNANKHCNNALPVSLLVLDGLVPSVKVNYRLPAPGLSLKLDCDHDLSTTDDRVEANEAAMGESLTYVLETEVPYMFDFEKYFFIIHSNLSKGLNYVGNLAVTLAGQTLKDGIDYEVRMHRHEDSVTELEIVFKNFIRYNTSEFIGEPIVISYEGFLNLEAEIGNEPNVNGSWIEYSCVDAADFEGEDYPAPEEWERRYEYLQITPEIGARTYTTALEIVCMDPIGYRLEGVELALSGEGLNLVCAETDTYVVDTQGEYWKLVDGSYTTISPDSLIDGAAVDKNRYDSLTIKYAKYTHEDYLEAEGESQTVNCFVGENGSIRLVGLGAGNYTIRGITAPEGFENLYEGISFAIKWNEESETFVFEGTADREGMACISLVYQKGFETCDPYEIDSNLSLKHSLNLAGDISMNYVVPEAMMKGYNMDTVYMEVEIPRYSGNSSDGWDTLRLYPEKKGGYYYFTLTGLTAVQMNDRLRAVLRGVKENMWHRSEIESYCIADYAMAQLNKAESSAALKTLCANLLRYGAKAQVYKDYRTDALADAALTAEHKAYLTDLNTVTFSNQYLEMPTASEPGFRWKGKSLNLQDRVGIIFYLEKTEAFKEGEDWKILVQYRNSEGSQTTFEVDRSKVYENADGTMVFTFSELPAADLRNVVCVAVYNQNNAPISPYLIYSADTYGNGKTGALGDVCKALFAYSDSAKALFGS